MLQKYVIIEIVGLIGTKQSEQSFMFVIFAHRVDN